MNLKENLNNILTAVGVAKADLKSLDLQDTEKVRNLVTDAISRQLQNDDSGASAKNVFYHEVAYDFHAMKELVQQSTGLDEKLCGELLWNISGDMVNATDLVLQGVTCGLPEQKDMKPALAEQSAEFLCAVSEGNYQKYLKSKGLTAKEVSLGEYKDLCLRYRLTQRLAEQLGLPDLQKASEFLDQKIDEKNPILQNKKLLEQILAARDSRSRYAKDEIRLIDVFTALSKSMSKAQLIAFYENRIAEQNRVMDDGTRLPDGSPIRINNVLGKGGFDMTTEVVGKPLTSKMLPASKAANKTPLPEHDWRGYARLYKLLAETVNFMYSGVQTGGFAERLIHKYDKDQIAKKYDKIDWDTEYEATPALYQSVDENGQKVDNLAGEFYNKVQARMLADRVKVSKYKAKLENEFERTEYSMQDVEGYLTKKAVAAKKGASPESTAKAEETELGKIVKLYERMKYYESRIQTAEHILIKLPDIVKSSPDILRNKVAFESLDQRIIELQDSEMPNDSPTTYEARCKRNEGLMKQECVQEEIKDTKDFTSQDDLSYALSTFLQYNNSKNAVERDASFEMLVDLFSIRKKYQEQIVTKAELEDLLQNVKTGPFNPVVVDKMLAGLKQGSLKADKCREVLHDSAVAFLKGKFKSYTDYHLSKNAVEQIQNM